RLCCSFDLPRGRPELEAHQVERAGVRRAHSYRGGDNRHPDVKAEKDRAHCHRENSFAFEPSFRIPPAATGNVAPHTSMYWKPPVYPCACCGSMLSSSTCDLGGSICKWQR